MNVNFYLPFWRDVLMALGFVDASFQSLSAALQRDRNVAVVLGGAAEVRVCIATDTARPERVIE